MFYCDECKKKRNYPESMFKSYGNCEICGNTTDCNDIPSSKLPKSEVNLALNDLIVRVNH